MLNTNKIISPCNNICRLNPADNICIGCGRTSNEITNWIFFSDEQRSKIMQELPSRLKKYSDADKEKTSQ